VARGKLDGTSEAGALLERVAAELGDAIKELRDLARGIYPPVLESDGLAEALRAAATTAALPTSVTAADIGRFDALIEAAVYFTCLEAMQNADKHAGPAAHVRVELARSPTELSFTIRDDGRGFDARPAPTAGGLVHIHDRVESIGGVAEIRSSVGRGTAVSCRVPLDASAMRPQTED
jgi:signal transduction histidine kinase